MLQSRLNGGLGFHHLSYYSRVIFCSFEKISENHGFHGLEKKLSGICVSPQPRNLGFLPSWIPHHPSFRLVATLPRWEFLFNIYKFVEAEKGPAVALPGHELAIFYFENDDTRLFAPWSNVPIGRPIGVNRR